MAWSVALAAAFLLISHPVHAQKRRETILRLRDDLSTAMAHVSLQEKQIEKLNRSRHRLFVAAQSGRARRTKSKTDLDGTLRDIERMFQTGPFLEEDRANVQRDVEQLRTIQRNQRARRQPGRP